MPLQSDDVSVLKDALMMLMSEPETESIVANLITHSSLHKLSDVIGWVSVV